VWSPSPSPEEAVVLGALRCCSLGCKTGMAVGLPASGRQEEPTCRRTTDDPVGLGRSQRRAQVLLAARLRSMPIGVRIRGYKAQTCRRGQALTPQPLCPVEPVKHVSHRPSEPSPEWSNEPARAWLQPCQASVGDFGREGAQEARGPQPRAGRKPEGNGAWGNKDRRFSGPQTPMDFFGTANCSLLPNLRRFTRKDSADPTSKQDPPSKHGRHGQAREARERGEAPWQFRASLGRSASQGDQCRMGNSVGNGEGILRTE